MSLAFFLLVKSWDSLQTQPEGCGEVGHAHRTMGSSAHQQLGLQDVGQSPACAPPGSRRSAHRHRKGTPGVAGMLISG